MITKTHFLSIWCMCMALTGYSQTNSSLQTQLQLLQKPSETKFPLDSSGFSKIKTEKFYAMNGDADVFDINSQNIHLVDFNNDGQKDIIYQENRLHQATVLLVKKGSDFVEIWNGPGAIAEVKQGKETIIYVRTNSIGCFPYVMLFELTMKNDNSFTQSTIGYHSDTEVKNVQRVTQKRQLSGILRTQPIVDDEKKKDPCTGDAIIGNQIRTLNNETVTILKKQDNWLLVVYKNNNTGLISWIKN